MDLPKQILTLCDLLCTHLGMPRKTLSKRLLDNSGRLDALAAGSDVYSRNGAAVIETLDEMWPADLEWPVDIPRPSDAPAQSSEAASGSDTKAPSGEFSLKTGGTDAHADVPPHFSSEAAE